MWEGIRKDKKVRKLISRSVFRKDCVGLMWEFRRKIAKNGCFYPKLEKFKISIGIDLLTLRDFLKLDGFMKLRSDMGDIRIFIEHTYFDKLRGMIDDYEKQIQSLLSESKQEIDKWVKLTMAKLYQLTDQEIRHYFPGTTEEDIKEFRVQGGTGSVGQ